MDATVPKAPKSPFPLRTKFPSKLERFGYKFYNYLDNSLYPVRPLYFGCLIAVAAAVYHTRTNLSVWLPIGGQSDIARYARIAVLAFATAYLPVLVIRLVTRHFLLTYKQWLFENPKKPSMTTRIWGVFHYLLSLVTPRLKSLDSLLPRQHIPGLAQTVERYLTSIRPLYSKDKLAEIEEMASDFLAREGIKLQIITQIYGLFVDNYVTGFWNTFAYLSSRKPVLVNSSVGGVDSMGKVEATQAFRAARLAYVETQQYLAIDSQTFKPLAEGMVCSSHLEKLHCTARVPGEKMDQTRRWEASRHIVVLYNGGIYKVHVVDEHDRIYTVEEMTDIFIELLTRTDSKLDGAAGKVASLTTDDRTQWSRNRRRFFEQIPKNSRALEAIESAIIALTLESDEYNSETQDELSHFMRSMLTGNGTNRWADKCFNHVISRNGKFGTTTEHSVADGAEFDAIHETFTYMEHSILGYPPLAEQLEREASFDASQKRDLRFAERLEIEIPEEMAAEIERCYSAHLAVISNLHVASLVFKSWGKDHIKKWRCSPDGFMQMAIQLANYRDQGHFVLTYESASTRFYRNSRTETLRTVSDESCDFVRAMTEEGVERSERADALRRACAVHVSRNRECMVGRGVDRHLFVLYVMAQATGTSSPFLNHCLGQDWLLSTSQTPVTTKLVDEDRDEGRFSWMGGGFGPVAEAGYGVCYRFGGSHSIFAHISSYRSAENTDSDRFRSLLTEALEQMSALFD